jgi:hypothetical protein
MSYLPIRPGTGASLFQHGNRGFGDYNQVGDWTWEFFGPNAFAWEDPADSMPQPAPLLPNSSWLNPGLSGCGCGCKGAGSCGDKHGMGQTALPAIAAPGGGVFGTGLFASTDLTTWGWGEWAVIAGGAYLGISLLNDVGSAGKSAGRTIRRLRS